MRHTSSYLEEPGGSPPIFMRPAYYWYCSKSGWLNRAASSPSGTYVWIIKRHPCHLLENCHMLVLLDDTLLWLTFVIRNIQLHYVHCSPWDMVPLCSSLSAQWHGAFASRRKKGKKERKKSPMATFASNMKMRNQIHCSNSWKVPVGQVGGVGMLRRPARGLGRFFHWWLPLLRTRAWLLLFICLQLERACKFQLLS